MSSTNQPNKKLLSIISASNRPHNMRAFFDNVRDTVTDHNCLEVLVKIDEGDKIMISLLEEAVATYPFAIRYIVTPKMDGYYTLHYGYQQLLELSDKDTYFIFPVNEEVRFKTNGWDHNLARYVKFFPDDLFRLKISRLKYRNYTTFHECGPCPENYPFATRKWMELAGGIGDCWGPDGWHQYIDYHLGQTEGIDGITGIFRSIPIQDILIGGEEAGKELTPRQIKIRSHRIFQEWWRMYRTEAQQEFRRIATRMLAYIWAENAKLEEYSIKDNTIAKCFTIIGQDQEVKKVFYYHVSQAYLRLENFRFLVKMARRNSVGFLAAFIYPSYGPRTGVRGWANFLFRYALVIIAVPLSFVTNNNESIPKSTRTRIYLRFKVIFKVFFWKLVRILPRSITFILRLVKRQVTFTYQMIAGFAINHTGRAVTLIKRINAKRVKTTQLVNHSIEQINQTIEQKRNKLVVIKGKIVNRLYFTDPLKAKDNGE